MSHRQNVTKLYSLNYVFVSICTTYLSISVNCYVIHMNCKGFSEIIGALQNSSEHTKEMFIAMTDVFSFRLDDGP